MSNEFIRCLNCDTARKKCAVCPQRLTAEEVITDDVRDVLEDVTDTLNQAEGVHRNAGSTVQVLARRFDANVTKLDALKAHSDKVRDVAVIQEACYSKVDEIIRFITSWDELTEAEQALARQRPTWPQSTIWQADGTARQTPWVPTEKELKTYRATAADPEYAKARMLHVAKAVFGLVEDPTIKFSARRRTGVIQRPRRRTRKVKKQPPTFADKLLALPPHELAETLKRVDIGLGSRRHVFYQQHPELQPVGKKGGRGQ